MEMEEALRVFETSVGWASDTAVAGVVGRVRREYERVGTVAAQNNGSAERFKVVLRRAQLEVKLIYGGWRPWLARVVAEVYPRRLLPPLLTHEM